MKRKSIISLLIFCMGLGMITTSCEDMLSPDSERHSYKVAEDTLYSYWGILKSLQGVAEKYVILGECRGDMIQGTGYVSDTIKALMNFGLDGYADKIKDGSCVYTCASDYYHIINSCNAYLAQCDTMRITGTNEKYMIYEYAQVEAIRAWTYLQLVQVYGEVPFYLEPMLTTDKINAFMSDPNKTMVNASNLADKLEAKLLKVEPYELYGSEGYEQYVFPQYETYGYTTKVCDATKCMFPISLVLGDLYLLKGDTESCKKAAQHYFTYLNTTKAGPLISDDYYCSAMVSEGVDKPFYLNSGRNPYNEKSEVSKSSEAITCIPSNTNKNWGVVLRDINRLFGYTANISVGVSSGNEVASISLTQNFERELTASKQFYALCDSQKYEVYIGTKETPMTKMVVLPGVGDARRYWAPEYAQRDGETTIYGNFVNKQNPSGVMQVGGDDASYYSGTSFSQVYPVIYRKAQIWLRYAEAINRAGYPSMAFAVLKNGLCNNETWFPDANNDYQAVTDTTDWYYIDGADTLIHKTDKNDFLAEIEQLDGADIAKVFVDVDTVGFFNYPEETSPAVCYYIDRREVKKNDTFVNFKTNNMRASSPLIPIQWKTDIYSRTTLSESYPSVSSNADNTHNITIGIHQRGCGRIAYDDRQSSFNYVDKVIEKAAANGKTLTKEDIYSGNFDNDVQNAVEDLIVDEMGLELAFEGTRFFDLSRVALRRNDPSYFASRVAMRKGSLDNAMYTQLLNTKNWYLPLPTND